MMGTFSKSFMSLTLAGLLGVGLVGCVTNSDTTGIVGGSEPASVNVDSSSTANAPTHLSEFGYETGQVIALGEFDNYAGVMSLIQDLSATSESADTMTYLFIGQTLPDVSRMHVKVVDPTGGITSYPEVRSDEIYNGVFTVPFNGAGNYSIELSFDDGQYGGPYRFVSSVGDDGVALNGNVSEVYELGEPMPVTWGCAVVLDRNVSHGVDGQLIVPVTITAVDSGDGTSLDVAKKFADSCVMHTPAGAYSMDVTMSDALWNAVLAPGESMNGTISFPFEGAGTYQVGFTRFYEPDLDYWLSEFSLDANGALIE